jgi:hypothetical protein
MQAFINRTSEITENVVNSAVGALYLTTYLGFSYMAMSMLTSFLAKLLPSQGE